jgi:hypothetical protein
MRTRKARIDSTSEAVRVMGKAASAIVPPSSVPLEKCDLPFFASVIAEFARSEWTAHQLELAAMLARTMADLNREQLALRAEGSVVHTEKGTPVVNPRKAVVQMHAASILSFRRSLSLHVRAQGGEARDPELIANEIVSRAIARSRLAGAAPQWVPTLDYVRLMKLRSQAAACVSEAGSRSNTAAMTFREVRPTHGGALLGCAAHQLANAG